MKKNIFYIIILSIITLFFVKVGLVFAADCASVPVSGNYTVGTSCTFAGTVNGVDDGDLTINGGVTLTINANQTIVWNAGKTITVNGNIAINKGGGAQLKKTNIWLVDSDNDGYPTTATPVAQDSQPAGGKRRSHTDFTSKFTYTSQITYDYNDSSASVYPGTECNGDCSINDNSGSCVAKAAGQYSLPACQTCNGSSLTHVTSADNTSCGTCQFCQSGSCVYQFYDSRNNPTLIPTVQIGTQCWMKQSMNVGTRIAVSSGQGTSCSSIQKYCYLDTDSNCTSNNPNYPDGGLYQWNQAMCGSTAEGAQGICPSGWHIPTDAQYKTLVEGQATPGCESGAVWQCSPAGTNLKPGGSSGFEGNLAGRRHTYGSFNNRGTYGSFWSSTQNVANDAWYRSLYSDYATVYRYVYNKAYGFSVRCLKD